MEIKERLEQLERRYGKRITWYYESPFYADSDGNISENGCILFCMETSFYCVTDKSELSFEAMSVLSLQHASKTVALDYATRKTEKLRCLGSIPALFVDSVDVIELENDRIVFLKLKGTEFKQMLKIAASKQKYSTVEYNRSRCDF